jgi:5-methylcytosine-specific restriction protein A
VSRANGGQDDEANLQTLCHACHQAKSSRETHGGDATRGGSRGGNALRRGVK